MKEQVEKVSSAELTNPLPFNFMPKTTEQVTIVQENKGESNERLIVIFERDVCHLNNARLIVSRQMAVKLEESFFKILSGQLDKEIFFCNNASTPE